VSFPSPPSTVADGRSQGADADVCYTRRVPRALNIAVAGCGPAGLASALLLSRDGHRVTVFERFERPRPVGSGLMVQPVGLAVLSELGLAERIRAEGARVERLFGRAGADGPVVLDVRYRALGREDVSGFGVHRAALFEALHAAASSEGLSIETGRTVISADAARGGRRLMFGGGGEAGPFDLVIDALGQGSPLAPATGRALAYGALWASLDWPDGGGFDPHALEQRYRAASGMAGVLPIGRAPGRAAPQAAFFWSLRADRMKAWREAGLQAWKAEVRTLWPATTPFLEQIVDPEQLTFARYAHRTLPSPFAAGVVQIGDAWHSASPQLGQGANMALLDAYALAAALRGAADVDEALARYVRLRRGHVRLYQRLSALFTPVYQSDSRVLPFVRDRLVGPVSKLWPATWIQAAMVGGLLGAPLGRLGLRLA
jgi:salicylate hydroxylase